MTVSGDTMRTVVRNLSTGQLDMHDPASDQHGVSVGFGSVEVYEPGRVEFAFALGEGHDRVEVSGMIATLRFKDRGTVRVTGQAVVRHAPVA